MKKHDLFAWLIPPLLQAGLGKMLALSLLTALIAGFYGIIHDIVTFQLSPEYFTFMKFEQFSAANLHWGDGFFVITIGFLATWWVGLIAGWILARLAGAKIDHFRFLDWCPYWLMLLSIAFIFGLAGAGYSLWVRKEMPEYALFYQEQGVQNVKAFVLVGDIHTFGYVGALVGLVITMLVFLRKNPRSLSVQK